ncbi:hypothetical protein PENSPDRAFT_549438, partial [Peniophora sp. CONT]
LNTVSASTGYAPFQLMFGRRPRILPPILNATAAAQCAADFGADKSAAAAELIQRMATEFADARDNLIAAKADQAASANKRRSPEHKNIKEGSLVMLSTYHRRREYVSADEDRAAK